MYFEKIAPEPVKQKSLPPPISQQPQELNSMAAHDKSMNPLHTLLQEVKRQTDPHLFMDPYDEEKVRRAAELNNQVDQVDFYVAADVMALLMQTVDELGCTYSPQFVYQCLYEQFDPTQHKPESKEFTFFNALLGQIYQVKDNIRAMNQVIKRKREEEEEKRKEAQRKREEEEKKRKEEQRKQEEEKFRKEERRFFIICVICLLLLIIFAVTMNYVL